MVGACVSVGRADVGIRPYGSKGCIFLPSGAMRAPWSAAEQVPLRHIVSNEYDKKSIFHFSLPPGGRKFSS